MPMMLFGNLNDKNKKMADRIKNKIINAYKLLLKNDNYLFVVNANERSLTHKLAECLQLEFPEYNVDCEYNRNGLDIKKSDSFKKNITSDDIFTIHRTLLTSATCCIYL